MGATKKELARTGAESGVWSCRSPRHPHPTALALTAKLLAIVNAIVIDKLEDVRSRGVNASNARSRTLTCRDVAKRLVHADPGRNKVVGQLRPCFCDCLQSTILAATKSTG